MASVPRAVLDYVSRQVEALSSDAQARIMRVLEAIDWDGGDIAENREALVRSLQSLLPTYTSAAAQAGADLYDAVRVAQVGEAMGAIADSGYDPDAVDGAIRALVQRIVDEKPVEQFDRSVLDRVDYEVRRACNVSVARNVARDPLGPRYARVPSGNETCTFCLMLASRGFVYTSAEAASHAHAGCDCRVVQGYPGMEVEGYDPDGLYDRWKLALAGTNHPFRMESDELDHSDILAGVPRGKPMSFSQADSGRVNPGYVRGAEDGYGENCQTCVVAFEARLRGYNVKAKPYTPGSVLEELSRKTYLAWINPRTGKPTAQAPAAWGQGGNRKTTVFLKEKLKPGERYVMQFSWKGREADAHIVNLDLNDDGRLRIKDNQRSADEQSEWIGDAAVNKYLREVNCRKDSLIVYRIDNLEFNREVVDEILEPA